MPGVGPAVLVVTDDEALSRTCRDMLDGAIVSLRVAETTPEARSNLIRNRIDLAIADCRNGHFLAYEVIRKIKAVADVPILALASSNGDPAAQCLELGADDCVRWPTSARELRVRVRLRGAHERTASTLVFDDLAIDTHERHVIVRGDEVPLTDREFDLLVYLARTPGRIVTADQILEGVWNSQSSWQTSRTVAEHVYRLRKKLETNPARPALILTHRRRGYSFAAD